MAAAGKSFIAVAIMVAVMALVANAQLPGFNLAPEPVPNLIPGFPWYLFNSPAPAPAEPVPEPLPFPREFFIAPAPAPADPFPYYLFNAPAQTPGASAPTSAATSVDTMFIGVVMGAISFLTLKNLI